MAVRSMAQSSPVHCLQQQQRLMATKQSTARSLAAAAAAPARVRHPHVIAYLERKRAMEAAAAAGQPAPPRTSLQPLAMHAVDVSTLSRGTYNISDVQSQQQRHAIDLPLFTRQLTAMLNSINAAHYDIAVTFVTDAAMQELNHEHRNKNVVTDVLSFPPKHFSNTTATPTATRTEQKLQATIPAPLLLFALPPPFYDTYDLGEVVIAVDYVHRECASLSLSLHERLLQLTAHSIAHLGGCDHENDADYAYMQTIENAIYAACNGSMNKETAV